MISIAKFSAEGEREINEDCVGVVPVGPDIVLCILADGLGGHGRGEEASALITETSADIFRHYYDAPDCLARCFETSQKALIAKQAAENAWKDLKSTLVLLKFCRGEIEWGHVGDSRLYYFKNGRVVSHTLDHSVPQMLVASGEITEDEIRHHPDRNRLIRVMGTEWDSPKYQISKGISEESGQAFLLCSDGFWENIEEDMMETSLESSQDAHEWLARMESIAYRNGKGTHMDNYSAVAVIIN